MNTAIKLQRRPKIVIVGAGFGGLRAARHLKNVAADVTLIDRSNHHLFQPLLYQVATAGLSPADIAAPIRSVLRKCVNVEVMLAEVQGVKLADQRVLTDRGSVPYDYLILATGSRHSYFGRDDWATHAPGLKSVRDATHIRRQILLAFERAEMEIDPIRRRALLNFVIVGGGPTGVEMAGSISELAHRALARDFRHINPREARIILVEAGPRLLAAFPEDLASRAREDLEKLGVEVRTGKRVEDVSENGVRVSGEQIPARTVIWAAGVKASPAGQWLGVETDRMGKVKVGKDLSVPGHPNVFVIGDTAHALGEDGKPLPGVAPVAMQQGRYVAKLLRARIKDGASDFPPFAYYNKGNLATIGRKSAIADLGRVHLKGFIAWVAWLFVHVMYLIGFRNRVLVLTQWAWAYVTYQRGARLIVDEGEPGEAAVGSGEPADVKSARLG